MKNFTYNLPESGFPMTDLQTKILENVLNLHEDMGGIETANEALFRMFELAMPYATEAELEQFTKLQGSMRCMNALVKNNQEAFELWIEEQNSYKPTP